MPLAVGTLSSPLYPGRANHSLFESLFAMEPIDRAGSYSMTRGPANWRFELLLETSALVPTAPRVSFRGHSRPSSSSFAGCRPHSPRASRAATAPDKSVPDPLPPAREGLPRLAIGLQPGP